MKQRKIGDYRVPAIGLGCMNLSHAYGYPPDEADAIRLLHRAVDLGVRHFDTAALYGFGANETLLGKALKPYRGEIHLASKCGMTGVDGKRVIDGRAETLEKTIDESLRHLQTDHINLYYLHRWDKSIPIEESVGALSRMVEQGKVGALGLSEVSAETLRKAHAVHPITAVQTEYSLWTRNAEIAVLDACRELDATFVAFSPVGRGFLAGAVADPAQFLEKDIRRNMPRFEEPHFSANRQCLWELADLAYESQCTMAQLALAWLLTRGEHVLPIPGTTSVSHLNENFNSLEVNLSREVIEKLDGFLNRHSIKGRRYPESTQNEIDTEEYFNGLLQNLSEF
ncbi:MAG: aldo/keto reductase [Spongiibacter sp.]|uniref:aldo/keto reductase n=1 Tax=Spongiibacter TaxID=630749 RepID=UPI001B13DFD1|nr:MULTISPECIES: aldo/keto reductase [Spongiibacter]MBO6753411.1 aldo/keto reductase [Spongiibacter sp.]|tara:strand:- start:447 stop:1466 length:1020 start_codon:yes stop_codon:yes gene_type:complete